MTLLNIFLLAIALSIDAFLVCFSYGLCTKKNKCKTALSLAFGVSFFQFLMPIIGAFFSQFIFANVEACLNILAGTIFIILGLKFLQDALKKHENDPDKCNRITLKIIVCLSIATSIDAFASGCSLYFLKISVFKPSLIIGLVTFINALFGFILANTIKNLAPKPLEIVGALIFILIGIRVFYI